MGWEWLRKWRGRGAGAGMRVPEFRHGVFCVLVVDPVDYVRMVSPGEESNTGREFMGRVVGGIRRHGGEVVETVYGPPVVGLWRCGEGAADGRVLEAARELMGAEEGLVMGASFGRMLYQEDRGVVVNVLGKASERADELFRLAKGRGVVLVVDDGIAMLGVEGEFESIGERAWAWRGAGRV
jgi:hypothetical protein